MSVTWEPVQLVLSFFSDKIKIGDTRTLSSEKITPITQLPLFLGLERERETQPREQQVTSYVCGNTRDQQVDRYRERDLTDGKGEIKQDRE